MPNDTTNKLQNILNRTTATIGVKTSVFVGSAKIKTQIATLDREITAHLQNLGVLVYELWLAGQNDPDRISRLCQEIKYKNETIASLNDEIGRLEKQEEEVLGVRTLETEAPSEVPSALVCPSCKAAYNAPIKFCRRCGTPMS